MTKEMEGIARRQLRKFDRMSSRATGKFFIILSLLALGYEQKVWQLMPVVAEGIECICESLNGISYTLKPELDLSLSGIKCKADQEDSCVCYQGDERLDIDFPSIEWGGEADDLDFDFECEVPTRNKRSPEGDDEEKEPEKFIERKSNILSRSLNAVGGIVNDAGNGIGSAVSSSGKLLGSVVEGGFHIVGKATRKVVGIAGGAVQKIGSVFEGSKTITREPVEEDKTRHKRSVEEMPTIPAGVITSDVMMKSVASSLVEAKQEADEYVSAIEEVIKVYNESEDVDQAINTLDKMITEANVRDQKVRVFALTQFKEALKDTDVDVLDERKALAIVEQSANSTKDEDIDPSIKEVWTDIKSIGSDLWNAPDEAAFIRIGRTRKQEGSGGVIQTKFLDMFEDRTRKTEMCGSLSQETMLGGISLKDLAKRIKDRSYICEQPNEDALLAPLVEVISKIPEARHKRDVAEALKPIHRKKGKGKKKKKHTKVKKRTQVAEEEADPEEEEGGDEYEDDVDEDNHHVGACKCDPDTGAILH